MKKLLLPLALSFCVSCSAAADDLCKYDIAGANLSNTKEEAVKIWLDNGFTEQEAFRGMGSPTTKTVNAPADAKHYIRSITFTEKSESSRDTDYKPKHYNAITVTYAPKKEAEDKDSYIAFQQELLKSFCTYTPNYIQEAAKQEIPNNDLQLRSKIVAAQTTTTFCAQLEANEYPKNNKGFARVSRPHTFAKRDFNQTGCFANLERSGNNGSITITYQSATVDGQ